MSIYNKFYLSTAHVRCQKGKVLLLFICCSLHECRFFLSSFFLLTATSVSFFLLFISQFFFSHQLRITNEDQYIFICYVFDSVEVQHF